MPTSAAAVDVHCVALEQTHAALKQHAISLESSLAERMSSEMSSDSSVRNELGERERQAAELTEHIEQLEQAITKEQQTNKDVRAQVGSLV